MNAQQPKPTPDHSALERPFWDYDDEVGVQNQSWLTEPEIGEERQRFLSQRRSITPDSKKGIFPFKDI